MSTTNNITNIIPWDVTANHILTRLNSRELCKFNLVSKSAQNIINYMATLPQEDLTIIGEKAFFICDGTFPDLLRQKIKMEILATLPPPPAFLGRAQTLLLKKHRITWQPVRETTQLKVKNFIKYAEYAEVDFGPLFVLFDYHTKHFDANLLEVFLVNAIHYDQISFIPAILFGHPNAKDIPGKGTTNDYSFNYFAIKNSQGEECDRELDLSGLDDARGLGLHLQSALNTYRRTDENKLEIVKLLFSHPNGNDILVQDLQKVMMYTVKGGVLNKRFILKDKWSGGSAEILRAIFSHPNSIHIPANGVDSLASALKEAKRIGNPEMIDVILSHPNAKDITGCSIM